jgi:hypothetical protein
MDYVFVNFFFTVYIDTGLWNRTGGVLRKISGPKRDGVTGEWRRLHQEQLYYLNSS